VEQLPIRTERLFLRPVADDDLPRLYSILADPEVMKLALYGRPLSPAEAQEFIDADFTRDVRDITHLGVLCRNDDASIVGFAGVLPCKYFPDDLEIGFVLGHEHQGLGYATEIAAKLVDVCFGILGRQRLLGLCEPRNAGSRKVLEKVGMSQIDEIQTSDRGRRVIYAINRSEATSSM
jgi:RimJ/RimL family protein N-acetyltransferase